MQSKKHSIIEQLLNVGSGFILSFILWVYVITPLWNIPMSMSDNIAIIFIFTVVSITRGYLWRRYFNGILTKTMK
jgi:hypothetical protein